MENHGAFFKGHGLELGREGIETAGAGERDGVVGQGASGDVVKRGAEGIFPALVFEIHELAVAGHAVGDPGVAEGLRADFGAPPLVGDGVGEEADAGLVTHAGAQDGGELGGPDGGQGVVGDFNDVEVWCLGFAKVFAEKVELFGSGLGELVAEGLVGDGEVDLHVTGAGSIGAEVAAGDDGAGKAGLIPLEIELVAGLAAGERDGVGGALLAAGEDLHALGNTDVDLGGEAVGQVAGHGEPAGGIEEVGDGLLNGSELEAFDGAVFLACDDAVVLEGPVLGLSLDDGRDGCDADGAVGEALAGEELAGIVGNLGDFEGGMEAEADVGGVVGGGEGDNGGGGKGVGGGVDFSVDVVGGDVEARALRPLGGERRDGEDGQGDDACQGAGAERWGS